MNKGLIIGSLMLCKVVKMIARKITFMIALSLLLEREERDKKNQVDWVKCLIKEDQEKFLRECSTRYEK